MLKRVVQSNIIKRLNHTHFNTTCLENNKTIKHLLRQQNKYLDTISQQLVGVSIIIIGTHIILIGTQIIL